jgi:hypothetical protein
MVREWTKEDRERERYQARLKWNVRIVDRLRSCVFHLSTQFSPKHSEHSPVA